MHHIKGGGHQAQMRVGRGGGGQIYAQESAIASAYGGGNNVKFSMNQSEIKQNFQESLEDSGVRQAIADMEENNYAVNMLGGNSASKHFKQHQIGQVHH